ncbi:MAG TPA: hypothetical protein VE526_03585 [Solirubrobacteraceae bacterium]|jgi:hypothetical protein|nr:hypothetical protein [Solirubrobacteraceae bacterium]
MRFRHAIATAVVAVTAWAVASVAGHAGVTAAADPPGMSLSRAGLTAQGTLGTHCADGICVDMTSPPEPRGRLPVRRRARVRLVFTRPAESVEARLGRNEGRALQVERVTATRWTVRLPRDLGSARLIDVFATGTNWDASFWGGIRAGCG